MAVNFSPEDVGYVFLRSTARSPITQHYKSGTDLFKFLTVYSAFNIRLWVFPFLLLMRMFSYFQLCSKLIPLNVGFEVTAAGVKRFICWNTYMLPHPRKSALASSSKFPFTCKNIYILLPWKPTELFVTFFFFLLWIRNRDTEDSLLPNTEIWSVLHRCSVSPHFVSYFIKPCCRHFVTRNC
jgi:hypothetical protein